MPDPLLRENLPLHAEGVYLVRPGRRGYAAGNEKTTCGRIDCGPGPHKAGFGNGTIGDVLSKYDGLGCNRAVEGEEWLGHRSRARGPFERMRLGNDESVVERLVHRA